MTPDANKHSGFYHVMRHAGDGVPYDAVGDDAHIVPITNSPLIENSACICYHKYKYYERVFWGGTLLIMSKHLLKPLSQGFPSGEEYILKALKKSMM